MAESIFVRVRRVLSAQIEDSVDAMERSNSDAVMREAIREADRLIDEVRRDQETAMTRRLQAARHQEMLAKKAAELTAKAQFALDEGREDLAEGALARQVDLEEHNDKLVQIQEVAKAEEEKLEENLAALRARKKQMEEALAAFSIARAEASLGKDDITNTLERDRRLENAEAAFDRALTGGSGIGFERGDAKAINQVAEIDSMSKKATVAERLAALKAERSKAA